MFYREKDPQEQPEEQVKNRCDDAGQDRAIETATVDDDVVVEQRRAADRDRQEHAERGAVNEIYPAVAASVLLRQDNTTLSLLVQKRREPALQVNRK